ncbi:MAG: DUF1178 family protein [Alphaproteobacteria bacterium]
MIRYNLRCAKGHEFEAWFGSAAAFDLAAAAGENACPSCGSTEVDKTVMAPAVSSRTRTAKSSSLPVAGGSNLQSGAGDPRRRAMRKAMAELRKKITENADYVGEEFPEEARKIHYEEVEPRGIYGEASGEDARELLEEGIDVLPLPALPEDSN